MFLERILRIDQRRRRGMTGRQGRVQLDVLKEGEKDKRNMERSESKQRRGAF